MKTEKRGRMLLQLLIFVATFGYIYLVTTVTLPKEGVEFAKIIIPFLLGTCLGTLINYNWGTSQSSSDKTEAAMANSESPPPPISPGK